MKLSVALLFFVIALVTYTQGLECGENEVLNTCAPGCVGLSNEKSCDPKPSTDQICPAVCRHACECAEGFSRHRNGRCVRTC